jgi:hypothetical protein
VTTSTTTPAEIRDRMRTVIRQLAPEILADHPFIESQHEKAAAFQKECEDNPGAAFRKFHVRSSGTDPDPTASTVDVEERQVTVTIMVAYPHDARAGDDQALDRDDVADTDRFQIDAATGRLGKANFTPPDYPAATWMATDTPPRLEGAGVDFLVITHTLFYIRDR